nr:PREDICTED: transmembrane protein 138 [Latimeria chalumnae]|eukprot:XP_014353046.1 PREDICTED: transmembrane protein 138 [Latimeria chalumnae]
MLQTTNYSLVLSLQFLLLTFDLFVNSFSELLRMAPVIQLVLFIIQDVAILFNVIIIFLMFFNTYVFQVGLVSLLLNKFKGSIIVSAVYLALSIAFHIWIMCINADTSSHLGAPAEEHTQGAGFDQIRRRSCVTGFRLGTGGLPRYRSSKDPESKSSAQVFEDLICLGADALKSEEEP